MLSCRINNAGTNSYRFAPLPDFDDLDLVNVVETNMLGVMLCCREARAAKLLLVLCGFHQLFVVPQYVWSYNVK